MLKFLKGKESTPQKNSNDLEKKKIEIIKSLYV